MLTVLLLEPALAIAQRVNPLPAVAVRLPTTFPRVDQALLKTALAKFFQAKACRTESTISMTATTSQVNINLQSQTETLTLLPRYFHSRLKLGNRNYEIISNGQQVWMLD